MTEQCKHTWHGFVDTQPNKFACMNCNKTLNLYDDYNELLAMLNEYETLKAAFTIAIHLLGHADFKNGNTGPGGVIDEGEVYACRLMDKIKALVPQLYANILEGKDD